jgi:hypothetical protein
MPVERTRTSMHSAAAVFELRGDGHRSVVRADAAGPEVITTSSPSSFVR